MKKILTIVGARPQFIKSGVVSRAIKKSKKMYEVLLHTGQHYDDNMSALFFKQMELLTPKYNLGVNNSSHAVMTGQMLIGIEDIALIERPDAVIVYGDTNSTLSGALVASKLGIPIAHVEAGLRSWNMNMPEEINRVLVDRISTWLFAPTEEAVKNLKNEGYLDRKIKKVGDVMLDAAMHYGNIADAQKDLFGELLLNKDGYILATIHRAENTDSKEKLQVIAEALLKISREIRVVFPLHPRVRLYLKEYGFLEELERSITVIDPVGYFEMISLEKNASIIVTDSGGVQKEAYFYGIPCVTIREETEWNELISLGWNALAPPLSSEYLVNTIRSRIGTIGEICEPYGSGDAATKIVNILESEL